MRLNEDALASVLADVTFIEIEIKRLGKAELDTVFDEVKMVRSGTIDTRSTLTKQTINIILSDAVSAYMEPSIRNMSYAPVKPVRLATILGKLSKGAAMQGGPVHGQRADRRRREADEVSRLIAR